MAGGTPFAQGWGPRQFSEAPPWLAVCKPGLRVQPEGFENFLSGDQFDWGAVGVDPYPPLENFPKLPHPFVTLEKKNVDLSFNVEWKG